MYDSVFRQLLPNCKLLIFNPSPAETGYVLPWQIVQVQISLLLRQTCPALPNSADVDQFASNKPIDLDLYCLSQGM